MSSIPRLNADKILVGGNDVSQPIGESDQTPTGTAILNGPVVCGKVNKTQNNYEGVLNVSSDSAPQISLDSSPKLNVNLAAKVDGNVKIDGDTKTANALDVTGDTLLTGNEHVTGKITTDSTINAVGNINGGSVTDTGGNVLSSKKDFDSYQLVVVEL